MTEREPPAATDFAIAAMAMASTVGRQKRGKGRPRKNEGFSTLLTRAISKAPRGRPPIAARHITWFLERIAARQASAREQGRSLSDHAAIRADMLESYRERGVPDIRARALVKKYLPRLRKLLQRKRFRSV